MKALRVLPSLVFGLAAVAAVLAWGARAAEAGGNVTTCDDSHLTTALSGGGQVTFSCGAPATISASSTHLINADTTIDGSNGGNPLTLTAASNVLLFNIAANTTLTLTHVTIADVNAGQGAILVNGALVINNSQFISNTSFAVESSGPVTITNTTFRANTGSAALFASQLGRLSVTDSQFISNATYAIWTRGPADVSNSQFFSNTAPGAGAGAGIFLDDSSSNPLTLTVTASKFMTNSAYGGGGGIYAGGGRVAIDNSQFSNNSATNGSGALSYQSFLPGDGLQVLNSTFTSNNHGAIAVNSSGGFPFLLANSTIQDNSDAIGTAGVSTGGMTVTVSHTRFINNHSSANDPGGLTAGGPVNISNSLFENNSGLYSGAAFMDNSGLPYDITDTVTSSAFLGNSASTYDGGGIYVLGAGLIVADSVFSDNVNSANPGGGGGLGGGLAWWNDANPNLGLSVSRSLFYNNQVTGGGTGGGLWIQGAATMDDSTVYSNSASTTGGLHLSNASSLTLTNDTLVGNAATSIGSAGNLFGGNILNPVAMVNTLVAGGNSKNCGGTIVSLGHNLSSDGTCPLTATGDLSGTNPLLGPFQNNGGPSWTLMPTALSPAVNAGDDAKCPAADQRGVARPVGAHCDMGAVETPYKTQQTISFSQLPPFLSIRTLSFTVSASATSGLAVSFTSLTPGVCSLSGATVTLLEGGTCTVRASQAGNTIFDAAANVDRSFVVQSHIVFTPVMHGD